VGIENDDVESLKSVCELEKVGDTLRRDIASKLYEGAFIPAVRVNLYRFSEVVDDILDTLEDCAIEYLHLPVKLDEDVKSYCITMAELNLKMSEDLISAFESLEKKADLRDATLKIRTREERIDKIKHDLCRFLMQKDVSSFWEGKAVFDFIVNLASVSNLIEDAGDIIQILNVSMR
jgi:predicted phosphate transport protein (TIGR00153 family)